MSKPDKSTGFRLLANPITRPHYEVDPEQAAAIADVLNDDFTDILLHQDLTGRPRFTTAVRR